MHESVKHTYNLMGSLESQSSESDEEVQATTQEDEENSDSEEEPPKKRKKKAMKEQKAAKKSRKKKSSPQGPSCKKLKISRPSTTTTSQEDSPATENAVDVENMPTPMQQMEAVLVEASSPEEPNL